MARDLSVSSLCMRSIFAAALILTATVAALAQQAPTFRVGTQIVPVYATVVDNQVQAGAGSVNGIAGAAGIGGARTLQLGHIVMKGNLSAVGSETASNVDCQSASAAAAVVSLGHNRAQATGPNCTLAATFSFRTLPDGVESGCRSFPMSPPSR